MARPNVERIAFALVIVLVPIVLAVAGWTTQEHPNRIDRYLFEYMGETVLAGGTVYLDCWDNKPPGLCWWNALVLLIGAGSSYAVTVATVLAAISAVAVTGWGVARLYGRLVASATMLLFALVMSQRYYDALTDGSEFYAMVAETFAAAFLVRAMMRCGTALEQWHGWESLLCAFLTGLAWGVAGMMKQTGAAGPIAASLALIVFLVVGPAPRRRWLGRFIVMGTGTFLVVGAVAAVLYRQGALSEAYYAAVTFNLDPSNAGGAMWGFTLSDLMRQLVQVEPLMGVGLLAAVGAIVTFIPHTPGDEHQAGEAARPSLLPRSVVVVLLAWSVVAMYGVMLGPNHMPRYWHALFAPGMWLAAQGIRFTLDTCIRGSRRRNWTAALGALALATVLLRHLPYNVYADAFCAHHYATTKSERGRLIRVGRRIETLTEPTDQIYVWGYSPGVYRFSSRQAACRFAGLDKLNNNGAGARAIASEILASLRARRPKLIAVERHRRGELLSNRAQAVAMDGLTDWFLGNYEPAETVDGFFLYVRRD